MASLPVRAAELGRGQSANADLVRELSSSPLLGHLGADKLRRLAPQLRHLRLGPGEVLLRQGQNGRHVYIVRKGKLAVTAEDDGRMCRLSTLGPGELVGEAAGMVGGRRTATVRSIGNAEVIRLPAATFSKLVSLDAAVPALIAEQADRRLFESHLATILGRSIPGLDGSAMEAVLRLSERVHLAAGDVLFSEGDDADAVYFAVFGQLQLATSGAPFGEVGRGEMVGSNALRRDGVRNATAYAVRDSQLIRLSRSAIDAVTARHPRAGLEITRSLLNHVRPPSTRRRAATHLSIAVVAGSAGVDLRMFTSRLVDELSRYTSTFHVWRARAAASLGPASLIREGEAHIALIRWLHELEGSHDVLVYEGDPSVDDWTKLVVRQADRVLVVVDAAERPPGATDELLAPGLLLRGAGRPRLELALLQRDGIDFPQGTAGWLDALPADAHYHVRVASSSDVARLGRVLAGRAVGLVLSGGGARGFAHLGALTALRECGLPIDLVGGTSIGAILATMPAAEIPPAEMEELARKRFSRVLDYTIPVTSVLKGRRTTRSMLAQFGGLQIEDLWLPYFCVSTSLADVKAVFHRRGPLVTALRASSAIPGVFPPVPIDGEVHVDGGVLDNLPIGELRRAHPDAVIVAVDVVPSLGHSRSTDDYGLWLSGWRAAWKRARPGGKRRYPGIADTLVKATVAASAQERNRMLEAGTADLYLPLDLRGVGTLAFDDLDPIVRRGHEQALPMIREWADSVGRPFVVV
jgi:predicted acylesterase/phospholipase RssA/CRP-like cAMP-binding protein